MDSVPYRKGPDGRGVPEVDPAEYRHGFGVIGRGSLDRALDDSRALLRLMRARGIAWVCVSAGSPYYCPHLIRPALFPPLDGYLPPEEPLAGVARHGEATARLIADFPAMVFVGSGDTYQQEFYAGEAEDRAEVLAVDAKTGVPFGSYSNMVKTADTTPLEPEVEEHKYYAEGVGFVYEEKVQGGDDRVRLVSMRSR